MALWKEKLKKGFCSNLGRVLDRICNGCRLCVMKDLSEDRVREDIIGVCFSSENENRRGLFACG